MGELRGLFSPDTVAVVGATERDGSVGAAITRNLLDTFEGDVVAVNPNADTVFGLDAVDSVAAVPGVDLAVLVVPPQVVLDTLETCGETGIDDVVVISAGFSETDSEGADRERDLADLAADYDINLVGPNCLGIMSTPSGLNATFAPASALPGRLSLMSQSGALVTAVVDWANDQHIGFRDVVSLGNKAVLDENDFLVEWGTDPDTDVIVGYLEGIEDGREFIDNAREVTSETPVVVLKSGRTDAGAKAASSHTGALAGSDRAYETGLAQGGVIRAESVQELFDVAQMLAGQPLPETDGIAVVTNAGGPGVVTTDAVGDSSLSMAELSEETVDRLREVLPDAATVHNPVDVLGDTDNERFRRALEILVADDAVGATLVLTAPVAVLDFDELAADIVAVQEEHDVPVVACLMGGERTRAPRKRLNEAGLPCYFDPSRAVSGLDALAAYERIQRREWEAPTSFDVDRERAGEILESVRKREGNRLGIEAMGLLEAYGIPTPRSDIVDSAGAAQTVAAEIGEPVVLKIVSPDVVHKTDIGGVRVGVDPADVPDVYEEIVTRTRNYQADARILGVQVQEMVDTDAGVETIVGVNRDPQFGPLLMFGLGGIFVEVLEDTTVRVAPVSERETQTMVDEIDSAPLLRGARGREPVDEAGVVSTIQRISQLVTDFPAIVELDINPLVALPDGVQAIDIRLTVDTDSL